MENVIMETQQTLKKPVQLAGIGVHTGRPTSVTLIPAPENYGIRIKKDNKTFECIDKYILSSMNQITIGSDESYVQTVEHILSALKGFKITNCLLEFTSDEAPIIDGSAYPFVEAIKDTGIVQQKEPRQMFNVLNPIWVEENDKYLILLPSDSFKVSYNISFSHPMLKSQYAYFEINEDIYEKEISRARTFGFYEDWEYLKSKGLALGSSLNNSVVYYKDGLLNDKLRYENECVRHKILDLIGDISLLGLDFNGHIIANKSGHYLDTLLVKKIRDTISNNQFSKEDIKAQYKAFEQKFSTVL
jgi:UDP-3-O-[3-hydroxymyristoyl] N-acetylglucosamine deacetylase